MLIDKRYLYIVQSKLISVSIIFQKKLARFAVQTHKKLGRKNRLHISIYTHKK